MSDDSRFRRVEGSTVVLGTKSETSEITFNSAEVGRNRLGRKFLGYETLILSFVLDARRPKGSVPTRSKRAKVILPWSGCWKAWFDSMATPELKSLRSAKLKDL